MALGGFSIHVVSSIGDPEDRRTWSTTPKSVIDALRAQGIEVISHDITIRPRWPILYRLANLLGGLGGRQPMRAGLLHRRQQAEGSRLLSTIGPGTFLHFGSEHIPVELPPGQYHYLFLDRSAHILLTASPFGPLVPARYRRAVLTHEGGVMARMAGVFTTAWYVRDDTVTTYRLPDDRVVAVGTGLGRITGFGRDREIGTPPYMLFVARHGFDIKGGPLLLDAFDIALRALPALRLVVIGSEVDRTAANWLARMKNHPNIDFHDGDTPRFEELVRGATLYCGPAESEPWGLIYLEALSCQVPVLALDRNAMRQFTNDGQYGFLVASATPEAVAAAMVEAMSDPDRLARMGVGGRDYVERNFGWDRAAMLMIEAMTRHAAGPPPSGGPPPAVSA